MELSFCIHFAVLAVNGISRQRLALEHLMIWWRLCKDPITRLWFDRLRAASLESKRAVLLLAFSLGARMTGFYFYGLRPASPTSRCAGESAKCERTVSARVGLLLCLSTVAGPRVVSL